MHLLPDCDKTLADSFKELYYKHWLSKSEIINDTTGYLEPIFDDLNFITMKDGYSCLILDYGSGVTIGSIYNVRFDKNFQPLAASVNVQLINNTGGTSSETINIIDWKILDPKYTKQESKETILSELGYGYYKNYFNKTNFVINDRLFKAIFFKNNRNCEPSLHNLQGLLTDLYVNNEQARNARALLNTVFKIQSEKRLTPEQIKNIGVQLDTTGYCLLMTSIENAVISPNIKTEIMSSPFSNLDIIKNDTQFLLDLLYDFAGISREKISEQRENLNETQARLARVSAIEKDYIKYRKRFINEYNLYFDSNVEIDFETIDFNIIPINNPRTSIGVNNDETTS